MKPNDKAIEAAARSLFGDHGDDEKKWVEAALTAAYAAQFQSEEYAGLIRELRMRPHRRGYETEDEAKNPESRLRGEGTEGEIADTATARDL